MHRLTRRHIAGLCWRRLWLCHWSCLWFCWVSNGRWQGLCRMCRGWRRLNWLSWLSWRLNSLWIFVDIPSHIHPSLWCTRWWLTWRPGSCSFRTCRQRSRGRRCYGSRRCWGSHRCWGGRRCWGSHRCWGGRSWSWGVGCSTVTAGPGLVDVPLGFLNQIQGSLSAFWIDLTSLIEDKVGMLVLKTSKFQQLTSGTVVSKDLTKASTWCIHLPVSIRIGIFQKVAQDHCHCIQWLRRFLLGVAICHQALKTCIGCFKTLAQGQRGRAGTWPAKWALSYWLIDCW